MPHIKTAEPPAQFSKIKVGVSACLLGQNVRFNGGHQRDRYVTDVLSGYFDWVPVCPEVEAGMGVPREPVRLVGDPRQPRMVGRESGNDWTPAMRAYIQKRLEELERERLCGFIFKSDSPSSGAFRVKIFNEKGGVAALGSGLFAGAFQKRFPLIPVEEEGRLHDMVLRENFIERVFAYDRLQTLFAQPWAAGAAVEFHSRHKLLLMAHSPAHYQELGRLTAKVRQLRPDFFAEQYSGLFLQALAKPATPARHANVLLHILGYFKRRLTAVEKADILQIISDYRRSLVPLVVPVTLLSHYVRKFDIPWLSGQYYLNPHPKELMLRNHV